MLEHKKLARYLRDYDKSLITLSFDEINEEFELDSSDYLYNFEYWNNYNLHCPSSYNAINIDSNIEKTQMEFEKIVAHISARKGDNR